MSDISTGYLYDVASRTESLEEYKKLLVSIADQKKNWIQIIKQIVSENEYSASAFARVCGVSRQAAQKWMSGAVPSGSAESYETEEALASQDETEPALEMTSMPRLSGQVYAQTSVEKTQQSIQNNISQSQPVQVQPASAQPQTAMQQPSQAVPVQPQAAMQ